jgi:hypothetical protein
MATSWPPTMTWLTSTAGPPRGLAVPDHEHAETLGRQPHAAADSTLLLAVGGLAVAVPAAGARSRVSPTDPSRRGAARRIGEAASYEVIAGFRRKGELGTLP